MIENNSWIKVFRKFREWEWYQDSNTKSVFLELLLTANYEDKRWQGIVVKRGQIITSINHLKIALNKNPKNPAITTQNIRTSLKRLKSTNELTIQTTTKYTLISINKYNDYQQVTNKLTNNQQTTNNTIINKEVKNDKNKDISHRIETFKKTVKDYVQENLKYKPVESEFIGYWTELNKTGKTFRYENERFFDMGKRLGTFLNRYTKKQRYNMTDETTRPEYKVLSSFKDFGAFIDYYKPYQQKAKDSLLPYSREIKDLAYAFINQNIRLDQAVTEFNKLRS